jgi:hypothetical protein
MVLDLFMEVEALREVVRVSKLGIGGKGSAYGRAYLATAYLAHSSVGPTDGLHKLLERFYPHIPVRNRWSEPRPWRERLLLERLGFTDDEVSRFLDDAERAEQLT